MSEATDDWGEDTQEFDLDGGGVDAGELNRGGGKVDQEGWYHFECIEVKPELETVNQRGQEKSPSYCFYLEVLESVDGQSPAGAKVYHNAYVAGPGGKPISDGSRDMSLRFGLGLGILKESEKGIVDAHTGETKITGETWMRGKGKQCIGKVSFEKGEGKFKDAYKIAYGRVYQVDDPQVSKVPKNKEALALIGKTGAPGKAAVSGKEAAAGGGRQGKEPAPQPAGGPSVDDFDLDDDL